jgi:Putative DNA-binding domain
VREVEEHLQHFGGERPPYQSKCFLAGPCSEGSLRLGVTKIDKFYNPFDCEFDGVVPDDLKALKTVREGWCVEYKREVPNASAIAKSITAFANTYGGWVFYGISEKSKEDSVAGEFPGILIEDADAFLQRIRQAVANHSQPTPYFNIKLLNGPIDSLGLQAGRSIIAVQVPWGPQTPYVHKDGRIYRRVGDGSEPHVENDRFILDQLWGRSSKIIQEYADWIEKDLELLDYEKGNSFIRVFLIADFWKDRRDLKLPTIEKMRQVIADPGVGYRIPFKSTYSSVDGIVCRQTFSKNPEMIGLTWRIKHGHRSEIVIPIEKYRGSIDDLKGMFNGYFHSDAFLSLCLASGYTRINILDLNTLFITLNELSRIYVDLINEENLVGPIYVKIQISGILRTIPFFDTADAVEGSAKNGIPFALQDKVSIFEGRDRESFIEMPIFGANPALRHIWLTMSLFASIASALGVAHGLDTGRGVEAVAKAFDEFFEAGERALVVLQRRKWQGHV